MQPAPIQPRLVAPVFKCLSPRSSSSLSSVTFMLTRSFCTVCIAGAAKSSLLRYVVRSRGPPARRWRASRRCRPDRGAARLCAARLRHAPPKAGQRHEHQRLDHRAAERRVLGAHAKRGAAARAACRSVYGPCQPTETGRLLLSDDFIECVYAARGITTAQQRLKKTGPSVD